MKTIGFAGVAALLLSMGAAMAQEGPSNDTMNGVTWPPPAHEQVVRGQTGLVQSGSSDAPASATTSGYRWTPGLPY